MNLLKRKSQDSYIRLLSLFERELKQYHKIFDSDNYYLNYIVSREPYSNDVEIRVTMSIIRKPLWLLLLDEPHNLKRLLEHYCRYFSVKDVTLVRPYYHSQAKRVTPTIHIPSIEERVSFEFFRDGSSWRPL